jgi:hypothetical protein
MHWTLFFADRGKLRPCGMSSRTALVVASLLPALGGCGSLAGERSDLRVVGIDAFSQPAPNGALLGASPLQAPGETGRTHNTTDGTDQDAQGSGRETTAAAGSADAALPRPTQPSPSGATPGAATPADVRLESAEINEGSVWIVDALVGQINGRPIFAQEFLEPIEATLLKYAGAPDRMGAWREAQLIIEARFQEMVNNELIISEAESQLTPEQQEGFFAWVKSLQEGTIAEYSGSREEARERLLEEEGRDLEDFIQFRRDTSLVQYLLEKKVKPRTIVAWRDIEREYLVREEQFNPPPMVLIGIVTLNKKSQAREIAQVQEWATAGKPFRAVAEELKLDKGGIFVQVPMKPGEAVGVAIESSEDLVPAVKKALKELPPGTLSQPIERSETMSWLAIAEVKQDPPRSLYDPTVQIALRRELNSIRSDFEQARYIDRLRSRWVRDDIDRVLTRLKDIALERYWRR